ncbi:hypothetical protein AX16_006251 [Volvariella volvacea WC 439]|nr:hypothetical protein AX16_006251 [Volvariella volvacea WC 439]
MLSDSESENEDLHRLTINEHYAKAFEYKKEREELQKLKEKYGSDFELEEDYEDISTDSESAESEDEDGEELTPAVDAAILRTLARIRKKDPSIYDNQKSVFEEERDKVRDLGSRKAKMQKSKTVTVRDLKLASALSAGSSREGTPEPAPMTYVEEQQVLRNEAISAFRNAVHDDEEDDLLVLREKTKDEIEQEEEEYRQYLEREVGDLHELVTVESRKGEAHDEQEQDKVESEAEGGDESGKKKKKKKKQAEGTQEAEKPKKTKEEEDQEFLINYILNRGWIDRDAKHIPTYKEVTSTKHKKSEGKAKMEPEGELDPDGLPTADPDIDEEDFEEIVDRFESSYNFRFEEPDAAHIPSFPRNIPDTVRREDSKRKEARERRKTRKEEELAKKREEVRRLKNLKMKEIRRKLETIGKEGGIDLDQDPALQELDLDGDWDPDAHDRQMAKLYADDGAYDEDADVLEKPVWDDDIDIGDIVPEENETQSKKKKKKKKKKDDNEEPDIGVDVDQMDADVPRNWEEEEWDGTEEMRKRKVQEYMDEIYGLDFNDMVAGIPTRFKYVPVKSQSFGLTPAEILMATDKELNEYMSVKKYAPYRKESGWNRNRGEKLKEFKDKVTPRMNKWGVDDKSATEDGQKPKKKRKGKKERQKAKAEAEGLGENGTNRDYDEAQGEEASQSKRKRTAEDVEGSSKRKKRQKA